MEERYILDTNTWIEFFHKRHGVADHIDVLPTTCLAASEVTIAELIFGAVNSSDYQRHIKEPLWLQETVQIYPISEVLNDYAEIRYDLKKKKLVVEDFDILIGATARHFGLTVVTDNVKHFEPMPGVKVVNWVERKKDSK